MLMSISRLLHDLSQQDFIHLRTLLKHTCHTPHILWKNPQAYTINIVYNKEGTPKYNAYLLGIQ